LLVRIAVDIAAGSAFVIVVIVIVLGIFLAYYLK